MSVFSSAKEVLFWGEDNLDRVLNGIIGIGLIIFAGASALSISVTLISLLALITPVFLIKVILKKGEPVKKTPLDIPILVYLVVILITSVASYRIEGWTYVSNSLTWFITTGIPFLTFYIVYYNTSQKLRKYLLMVFALGMAVNCLYALIDFLRHMVEGVNLIMIRPSGFLFWVTYATLTVFAVLIAMYFIFSDRKWFKVLGWVSFVLISLGVIFSLSRSSVIAYFLSITTYILLKKKYIFLIIIPIFIAGLILGPDMITERLKGTFIDEDGGLTIKLDETYDERGVIFRTGFEIIKSYPIFGVGPKNIATEYLKFRTLKSEYNYAQLHNNFINITAESGILGLGAYILLLVFILKVIIRGYRSYGVKPVYMMSLSFSLFVAFFITGLVRYNFGDFEVLNAFLFIFALSILKEREEIKDVR